MMFNIKNRDDLDEFLRFALTDDKHNTLSQIDFHETGLWFSVLDVACFQALGEVLS